MLKALHRVNLWLQSKRKNAEGGKGTCNNKKACARQTGNSLLPVDLRPINRLLVVSRGDWEGDTCGETEGNRGERERNWAGSGEYSEISSFHRRSGGWPTGECPLSDGTSHCSERLSQNKRVLGRRTGWGQECRQGAGHSQSKAAKLDTGGYASRPAIGTVASLSTPLHTAPVLGGFLVLIVL